MSTKPYPWSADRAAAVIAERRDLPGALPVILHALQDVFGYIDDDAIPLLADALNLSRADVLGVVSFYQDFRRRPAGRHVVRLCRGEACQAMGAAQLAAHAQSRLAVNFGQTSPDGAYTLEPVYCLGNCARSPAAMLGERIYGRVTPQRFDALVAALGGGDAGAPS